MENAHPIASDGDLIELFRRVDNTGRWGPDDELGTLNYITPEKRCSAAQLVRTGETLSLARPISSLSTPPQPEQLDHRMLNTEMSADDYLGMTVHQQGLTHLDCVSHLESHDGKAYNNRPFEQVVTQLGVTHGSVFAQREGIVSRGVLLDIPAARGVEWLEPADEVSDADLDAAEAHAGLRVGAGDVAIVRGGVEARSDALGSRVLAPGPAPSAIGWLHEREVAVYAGDMPERVTPLAARILGLDPDDGDDEEDSPTRFPLPFHQIAIPAMGLVLLDFCRVEALARKCRQLGRYEFLFVAIPLALEAGTGSPVNPVAVF